SEIGKSGRASKGKIPPKFTQTLKFHTRHNNFHDPRQFVKKRKPKPKRDLRQSASTTEKFCPNPAKRAPFLKKTAQKPTHTQES
ncbi:MAG: hypothetical protein ACKPHU_21805, partial [Planctomycetaceae bacterium]